MKFVLRSLAIAGKELVQLRRDRLTLGMVVGIPALQLLLFGYAINSDVRHLRAGVANLAGSQLSRTLVEQARSSQVIDLVHEASSAEELETLLRQGRIAIGLYLPPDFERRLAQGDRPAAQLLVDASDPIVLGAAEGLLRMPLDTHPGASPARLPAATFEVRAYYNPERRSEVQIVPGLIGVILTLTMSLFTAVAIVRERERGTLELLITTPVRTAELMVGKILPYVGIGLLQVGIILLLGRLLFHVPVRGSILDLFVASFAFIASTLTFGLLVSTAAKNQFQAFQLTIFFFLPSLLLSGFMFPFDGMPRAARMFAEVLPLTHFVRIVRGIILRGASLPDISREMWPLAVFFAVTLALAILRFRKRLD
jgi:ABC-2 type transport system permease protein